MGRSASLTNRDLTELAELGWEAEPEEHFLDMASLQENPVPRNLQTRAPSAAASQGPDSDDEYAHQALIRSGLKPTLDALEPESMWQRDVLALAGIDDPEALSLMGCLAASDTYAN